MFAESDLAEFEEARRRRNGRAMPCRSTGRKGSPFYQYDFQWRSHRFHGSTKQTSKREAEKAERVERERAKKHIAQANTAKASLRLDDVAGRYWNEVGQRIMRGQTIRGDRLASLSTFLARTSC